MRNLQFAITLILFHAARIIDAATSDLLDSDADEDFNKSKYLFTVCRDLEDIVKTYAGPFDLAIIRYRFGEEGLCCALHYNPKYEDPDDSEDGNIRTCIAFEGVSLEIVTELESFIFSDIGNAFVNVMAATDMARTVGRSRMLFSIMNCEGIESSDFKQYVRYFSYSAAVKASANDPCVLFNYEHWPMVFSRKWRTIGRLLIQKSISLGLAGKYVPDWKEGCIEETGQFAILRFLLDSREKQDFGFLAKVLNGCKWAALVCKFIRFLLVVDRSGREAMIAAALLSIDTYRFKAIFKVLVELCTAHSPEILVDLEGIERFATITQSHGYSIATRVILWAKDPFLKVRNMFIQQCYSYPLSSHQFDLLSSQERK